jgi:hypothetical protein
MDRGITTGVRSPAASNALVMSRSTHPREDLPELGKASGVDALFRLVLNRAMLGGNVVI